MTCILLTKLLVLGLVCKFSQSISWFEPVGNGKSIRTASAGDSSVSERNWHLYVMTCEAGTLSIEEYLLDQAHTVLQTVVGVTRLFHPKLLNDIDMQRLRDGDH